MSLSSRTLRLGTAQLLLSAVIWFTPKSSAQSPAFGTVDSGLQVDDFKTFLNPQFAVANPAASPLTDAPMSRTPRLRLFRFTPGFLADPLGMLDGNGLPGMSGPSCDDVAPPVEDSGPQWIQIGSGADVPFFDLRCPGDPGGFGYYRVNTQMALLDSPTTACSFTVQTVTPAGAQFGGLPNGPTVVIPDFSVFHALNDRLALQGFVSKNVPILDADSATLQRNVQYGMALQRPILTEGPEALRSLFFTVGALGQLAPDRDSLQLVPQYDFLPGFQWYVNKNWWLSSAVMMPFGTVRTTPNLWHLTCSLQF